MTHYPHRLIFIVLLFSNLTSVLASANSDLRCRSRLAPDAANSVGARPLSMDDQAIKSDNARTFDRGFEAAQAYHADQLFRTVQTDSGEKLEGYVTFGLSGQPIIHIRGLHRDGRTTIEQLALDPLASLPETRRPNQFILREDGTILFTRGNDVDSFRVVDTVEGRKIRAQTQLERHVTRPDGSLSILKVQRADDSPGDLQIVFRDRSHAGPWTESSGKTSIPTSIGMIHRFRITPSVPFDVLTVAIYDGPNVWGQNGFTEIDFSVQAIGRTGQLQIERMTQSTPRWITFRSSGYDRRGDDTGWATARLPP